MHKQGTCFAASYTTYLRAKIVNHSTTCRYNHYPLYILSLFPPPPPHQILAGSSAGQVHQAVGQSWCGDGLWRSWHSHTHPKKLHQSWDFRRPNITSWGYFKKMQQITGLKIVAVTWLSVCELCNDDVILCTGAGVLLYTRVRWRSRVSRSPCKKDGKIEKRRDSWSWSSCQISAKGLECVSTHNIGLPQDFSIIIICFGRGRIKFYTHPPEEWSLPSHVSSDIVKEWGKAFDLEALIKEEKKELSGTCNI